MIIINTIKRFWKQLIPISKEYSKCRLYFIIDALFCFIRYGASPNDYMRFRFYGLNSLERKKFITFKKKRKLEKKYNQQEYIKYFLDKKSFNEKFKKYINRDWIFCGDSTEKQIDTFIKKHGKIIAKPCDLLCGKGIFVLDKNDYDKQFLISNKYLIEEFIEQEKTMCLLNESSVNTVRIYTVLNESLKATPIFAILRVGSKNNNVDNYHGGGTVYPLDLETGIVCAKGASLYERDKYIFCPSTNFKVLGFQIPYWQDAINAVKDAATFVPQCRLIGWDVAFTTHGVELIEGNHNACNDLLQSIDCKGKYILEKRLLKSKGN